MSMTTRVLIVEDHADSAEFLRLLLEPEGYLVKTAGTAKSIFAVRRPFNRSCQSVAVAFRGVWAICSLFSLLRTDGQANLRVRMFPRFAKRPTRFLKPLFNFSKDVHNKFVLLKRSD